MAFDELAPVLGIKPACDLLGHSRAGHYRRLQPPVYGPPRPRPTPPNALSETERALHTAASVHYGTAGEVRELRQQTLDAAYAAKPDPFSHQRPAAPKLPTVAWIDRATPEALIQRP